MATLSTWNETLQRWQTLTEVGINGRGVKRPGTTKSVGGRTVVIAEDVSNQATEETKPL